MKLGTIAAAAAMLSLTAAPAMAQATQSASAFSVAGAERLGASVEQDSELAGSNLLIGIVVVAAIIGAIIVVADDNDDEPVSP